MKHGIFSMIKVLLFFILPAYLLYANLPFDKAVPGLALWLLIMTPALDGE